MLDLDTGIDPFPYGGDTEKWLWWYKSSDETTPRHWAIIADDRFFWINWCYDSNYNDANHWRLNCFGDIVSHVPNDQWYCIINGSYSSTNADHYEGWVVTLPFAIYNYSSLYFDRGSAFARSFDGQDVGVPLLGAMFSNTGAANWYHYLGGVQNVCPPGHEGVRHPSPVDGGTIMQNLYSIEGYTDRSLIRGEVPGAYGTFHSHPFSQLEIRKMTGQLAGREFINCRVRGGSANPGRDVTWSGQVLIDIKNKWR
jgi:hypothetical protein